MRSLRSIAQGITVMALLIVLGGSVSAGAQGSPNPSRGSRGSAAGCQEGTPAAANDPNCSKSAPGFAAPMLDSVVPDSPRAVTALVRVDAMMKRPPVALPNGNSFTLVGTATLIKVRRADQAACLATGKRISSRVNAATSTTCLDHKGDLLAVEECTPGTPDCAVVLAEDIARQQTPAARP